MPVEEKTIPPSEWRAIVENVPLVSVDLVVGGRNIVERRTGITYEGLTW